jgi:hypothetical protein
MDRTATGLCVLSSVRCLAPLSLPSYDNQKCLQALTNFLCELRTTAINHLMLVTDKRILKTETYIIRESKEKFDD